MTQFGSTQKEEIDDDIIRAKKVRDKAATLAGMNVQLQIHEQRFHDLYEKLRSMEAYCKTLELRMEAFQKQRVAELQARVGHGPTT